MKRFNLLALTLSLLALCSTESVVARGELPDTTYTSASKLEYRIEVDDTLKGARMRSYRDLYEEAPGIFTFRGSPMRDMPYAGRLDTIPTYVYR